jgi:hypothetical protein
MGKKNEYSKKGTDTTNTTEFKDNWGDRGYAQNKDKGEEQFVRKESSGPNQTVNEQMKKNPSLFRS